MSDLNKLLDELYESGYEQAADLIEQLQARVVELGQERDEIAKEKDMEHYHRRAVDEENQQIKQERDELAAHVALIYQVAESKRHGISDLRTVIGLKPATSLAEHDYKIAYNAFHAGITYADTVPKGTGDTPGSAKAYAERIKNEIYTNGDQGDGR